MMLLLAQAANPWDAPVTIGAWLGCLLFVAMLFNALGKVWDRLNGKSRTNIISPQPIAVEITKQLHEKFADKHEFEDLRKHTTERHAQIFNRIDKVERVGREEMDKRFKDLNEERRESLEKLNDQFTYIRENIAAINRELQIRHEQ